MTTRQKEPRARRGRVATESWGEADEEQKRWDARSTRSKLGSVCVERHPCTRPRSPSDTHGHLKRIDPAAWRARSALHLPTCARPRHLNKSVREGTTSFHQLHHNLHAASGAANRIF